MTNINKKGNNNKLLLSSRNRVEAPPTETTLMLAAILDGKNRPKKRPKKPAKSAAGKTDQSTASKSQALFSRTAAFGTNMGLAQLPNANKTLKRKRDENVGIAKLSLEKKKNEDVVKPRKNKKDKENPLVEVSTTTATAATYLPIAKMPKLKINPYKRPHQRGSKQCSEANGPSTTVNDVGNDEGKTETNDRSDEERSTYARNRSNPTTQHPINGNDSRGKPSDGNEATRNVAPIQAKSIFPPRPLDVDTENENNNVQKTPSSDPPAAPEEAAISQEGIKLGLKLSTRLPANRRRRSRSLPPSANNKSSKQSSDELAVVGAMLSKTAATQLLGKPTQSRSVVFIDADIPIQHDAVSSTRPTSLLPPMKPLLAPDLSGKTTDGTKKKDSSMIGRTKPAKKTQNDNFVRLNLRNSAGSCRGARNKKTKNRKFDRYKYNNNRRGPPKNAQTNQTDEHDANFPQDTSKRPKERTVQRAEHFRSGVDPLDDYLDGVLHQTTTKKSSKGKTTTGKKGQQPEIPKCTRHQRPCKLLTVKKTGTGNKGRKFYCCFMPRGEQCDHFQWADDTIQAAKMTLLKNSSHSGFMARQVAAYSERFKKLTVPELRNAAKRRGLDTKGKKQQLLLRLSLWVRDELATVAPKEADKEDKNNQDKADTEPEMILDVSGLEDDVDNHSNSDLLDVADPDVGSDASENEDVSCCSSSDGELELFHKDGDIYTSLEDHPSKDHANSKKAEADEQSEVQSSEQSDAESGTVSNPTPTIQETLEALFGYDELREGQEWAVKRCLAKQKSLLVSPTGYGKSMCYILPAALMDGVCIVVSPLISLIQDQLRELPPRIPAATLSGSLTSAATAAIVDDVLRQRIKILFVSPERLASSSFQRLFQPKWNRDTNALERPFPTVSLLCVDEAHCLSQWAHNFRPSYLRLRSLIHKIEPQSVLAITATAGRQVIQDICNTLHIDQCSNALDAASGSCRSMNCPCGVWTMKTDRENIDVKTFMVPSQELRLSMLVDLLKKPKSSSCKTKRKNPGFVEGCLSTGSIIVYVWRQRDAEVVAESIQASGVAGGVVYYHGGMDNGARSNAYSKFMRGKARICVATVAFGLGVNKPDIAGVIHMYLPASPEHYLQEIGRAGRDGRPAQAIALVLGEEALVRHSQPYSDGLSQSQVRSVIFSFQKKVKEIIDSAAGGNWADVPAIGVPIPLSVFSTACDCKAETIETIFSLLELREHNSATPSIQVEGIANDQVTISLKRRKLQKLAELEAVAKVIESFAICVDAPAGEGKSVAEEEASNCRYGSGSLGTANSRQQQFVAYSFGSYRFSVTECANMLGPAAQPRHVFAALRRLQSNGEIELNFDKTATGTALRVILNNSGLRMLLGEDDNPPDHLESISAILAEEMNSIARVSARKVLDMHFVMQKVADVVEKGVLTVEEDNDVEGKGKSKSLALFQELCHRYFNCPANSTLSADSQDLPSFDKDIPEKEILIDALALISDLSQNRQALGVEFALDLPNMETLDYTALALTKFFHGMASIRAPMSICRHHRLFGKWQRIRFDELLNSVHQVLMKYKS